MEGLPTNGLCNSPLGFCAPQAGQIYGHNLNLNWVKRNSITWFRHHEIT